MITKEDAHRLEFVEQDEETGNTVWRDPKDGGTYDLALHQLIPMGLTDKLRAALNDRVEEVGGARIVPGATERPPEATSAEPKPEARTGLPDPKERGVELLGGHTDEWRWQRVEDGDVVLWVIDNKPAVENWYQLTSVAPPIFHNKETGAVSVLPPEFQKIVIPEEVLQAIVRY